MNNTAFVGATVADKSNHEVVERADIAIIGGTNTFDIPGLVVIAISCLFNPFRVVAVDFLYTRSRGVLFMLKPFGLFPVTISEEIKMMAYLLPVTILKGLHGYRKAYDPAWVEYIYHSPALKSP